MGACTDRPLGRILPRTMSTPAKAPDPVVKNILFATDFSEASHAAAPVAHAHAKRWGATVHILFVGPAGDKAPHPELESLEKEVGADVPVKSVCESGDAADQILAYAEKNAIDLIVMGTHGRTGVSRVLLGSVAERVTRMAITPVLTVPRYVVHAAASAEVPPVSERSLARCIVCGTKDEDLICQHCRAKIRGEAIVKTF